MPMLSQMEMARRLSRDRDHARRNFFLLERASPALNKN